ncbi:AAA family ATPase [Psychrobacillus sp.]|uniref:AAA family ATPase n=1 Tax=Psychrobacillus sp. TaxID=1871623 RepID=UPI0028BD9E1A|nr:AAA family ATPase [Psychrobacillus sp.]
MKRFVIMTVGKTHSGKTTFAKALEKELLNSVVIDQDNHAEFLQTYYQTLLPKQGNNMIKYAITETIVNYAVNETDCHIILCNSNRNQEGRLSLLEYYQSRGFGSILVDFDIPDDMLKERIEKSQRTTTILRTALNFGEVFTRQNNEEAKAPIEGEADYLLVVTNEVDVPDVIGEIVAIAVRRGIRCEIEEK